MATDEAYQDLVDRFLGEYRVEQGPEDFLFQADLGCPKILPGGKSLKPMAHLYLGSLRIFYGARWEEMTGRLVSAIRDLSTVGANQFFRFRAAGATLDGHALLMPSAPNPHLPALAASLVRAGAGYLGDEVVNVDPVLRRVHGIALPILLDSSDLRSFPDLAGGRIPRSSRLAGKRSAGAEGVTRRTPVTVAQLGGVLARPTQLSWIVLPVFSPGVETHLEPVPKAEAVFRLLESLLNAHIWTERALVFLRDLVDSVAVSRLVIGSLSEATDLLLDLPAHEAPTE